MFQGSNNFWWHFFLSADCWNVTDSDSPDMMSVHNGGGLMYFHIDVFAASEPGSTASHATSLWGMRIKSRSASAKTVSSGFCFQQEEYWCWCWHCLVAKFRSGVRAVQLVGRASKLCSRNSMTIIIVLRWRRGPSELFILYRRRKNYAKYICWHSKLRKTVLYTDVR